MAQLIRAYQDLTPHLRPGKVLIIYGPRQVGKTTLLKNWLTSYSGRYRLENGDDMRLRLFAEQASIHDLLDYAHGYDLIAIDEAQKIPRIGEIAKILVDHTPSTQIILTGSCSLELAGQTGEPLTGRQHHLTLYPMAQHELYQQWGRFDTHQTLEQVMVTGSYPEVFLQPTHSERIEAVESLCHSYLLKDILSLEKIKKPQKIFNLLRLIAYQIGGTLSHHELATQLGLDTKTVQRYLDLLEKSFVIHSLGGYSRNLRKEISKKNKYYFYDCGIRNALISNFQPLSERNDIGQLWENFVIMERLKSQSYQSIRANYFFWRTWDGQEIDWIEEREGNLFAFEIKWQAKQMQAPKAWREAYPDSSYTLIHPDNRETFLR